ncbi:MAG: hypothetical protein U1E62_01460 [Alsobacter sp.]
MSAPGLSPEDRSGIFRWARDVILEAMATGALNTRMSLEEFQAQFVPAWAFFVEAVRVNGGSAADVEALGNACCAALEEAFTRTQGPVGHA